MLFSATGEEKLVIKYKGQYSLDTINSVHSALLLSGDKTSRSCRPAPPLPGNNLHLYRHALTRATRHHGECLFSVRGCRKCFWGWEHKGYVLISCVRADSSICGTWPRPKLEKGPLIICEDLWQMKRPQSSSKGMLQMIGSTTRMSHPAMILSGLQDRKKTSWSWQRWTWQTSWTQQKGPKLLWKSELKPVNSSQ